MTSMAETCSHYRRNKYQTKTVVFLKDPTSYFRRCTRLRPLFVYFPDTPRIYRMSQKECARLQEGVPYVKVCRYNPKHLCPKLNGYGDNGQRKVWPSLGFHALYLSADSLIGVESLSVVSYYADTALANRKVHMYFFQGDVSAGQSCVMYSAWIPKDNYDMSSSVFVVQFNGFMSLKS
jgi:hypothetical protein